MIKGIIFDLRVIAENDFDKQLKEFCKELKIDHTKVKTIQKNNQEKMLIGKLSVKELCSSIRGAFKLEDESEFINIVWDKHYDQNTVLNKELIIKIKELRKKYKLALVAEIFDSSARIHQKQGIYQYFKPVLLSCRISSKKVEEKMFERMIKDIGFTPKECLYIDKDKEHLEIAKSKKINVIEYKNNEQLFKDLKKLKIN
jgi:FMN phosphatase YigB (HAD superfamily)